MPTINPGSKYKIGQRVYSRGIESPMTIFEIMCCKWFNENEYFYRMKECRGFDIFYPEFFLRPTEKYANEESSDI
jgi:hypothetical protein